MSAIRRFMAMEGENNIFKFTIDTRNIVVGATNGAENPLTFRLPLNFPTNIGHQFIIRVNDGRDDVVFDRTEAGSIIHFATAGIYQITLIGRSNYFLAGNVQDNLKWIYLDVWGTTFRGLLPNAFQGMTNLVIRAHESIKLTGNRAYFFNGIKGFALDFEMSKLDVSEVSNFSGFFSGVQLPMYSVLNPFINAAESMVGVYRNVDLTNVSKVEVISQTASNFGNFLSNSNFTGELIIKAPLISMYQMLFGIVNPPALGKVDIRGTVSNTSFSSFITHPMTEARVDSTLLGWANNYDWTGIPLKSITMNWRGSKYSNNPAVIAARAFLISKGFTFQNLTMA